MTSGSFVAALHRFRCGSSYRQRLELQVKLALHRARLSCAACVAQTLPRHSVNTCEQGAARFCLASSDVEAVRVSILSTLVFLSAWRLLLAALLQTDIPDGL